MKCMRFSAPDIPKRLDEISRLTRLTGEKTFGPVDYAEEG